MRDARRDDLHGRLRAATAPQHEGLERDLDWRARVATLSGYRALLARLHGFHGAYEPAIARALRDDAFLASRRRLLRLEADLTHLGLGAEAVAALPRPDPVRLDGPAAATGALYVLEGSTLGGQLIGRHIGALHGLGGDGLAYYRAHGPATGAMWAAFRARLALFEGDAAAEAALTEAAVATFAAMRAWLCAEDAARAA
jgi:heme oxygenase (biliverdin-IX-beta and delta-forming)